MNGLLPSEHLLIQRVRVTRASLPREKVRLADTTPPKLLSSAGVEGYSHYGLRQGARRLWIEELGGVTGNFRNGTCVRGDNRTPVRHRFKYGYAKSFIQGWIDEEVRVYIKVRERVVVSILVHDFFFP
jgi:hypothetical protein